MSYHNLAEFGWLPGVHRAPTGYQHRWLVVTAEDTSGYRTREEARAAWSNYVPPPAGEDEDDNAGYCEWCGKFRSECGGVDNHAELGHLDLKEDWSYLG